MRLRDDFAIYHKVVWGKNPALFTARRDGVCCWCGQPVSAGDPACYWPEHDARLGHAECLHIATMAES